MPEDKTLALFSRIHKQHPALHTFFCRTGLLFPVYIAALLPFCKMHQKQSPVPFPCRFVNRILHGPYCTLSLWHLFFIGGTGRYGFLPGYGATEPDVAKAEFYG